MPQIEDTLEERGNRYGEFDEHARITQSLKFVCRTGKSWELCTDSVRESIDMICHKIGRIVNGDPNYKDSWVDIEGYAHLVSEQLDDD